MPLRKIPEIALYDWVTESKRIMLIYVNRKRTREDPGILCRIKSGLDIPLFKSLYERGFLTGEALQEAKTMFQ